MTHQALKTLKNLIDQLPQLSEEEKRTLAALQQSRDSLNEYISQLAKKETAPCDEQLGELRRQLFYSLVDDFGLTFNCCGWYWGEVQSSGNVYFDYNKLSDPDNEELQPIIERLNVPHGHIKIEREDIFARLGSFEEASTILQSYLETLEAALEDAYGEVSKIEELNGDHVGLTFTKQAADLMSDLKDQALVDFVSRSTAITLNAIFLGAESAAEQKDDIITFGTEGRFTHSSSGLNFSCRGAVPDSEWDDLEMLTVIDQQNRVCIFFSNKNRSLTIAGRGKEKTN